MSWSQLSELEIQVIKKMFIERRLDGFIDKRLGIRLNKWTKDEELD